MTPFIYTQTSDYASCRMAVSAPARFLSRSGKVTPVRGKEAWEVKEGAIPAFAGRAAQLGSLS